MNKKIDSVGTYVGIIRESGIATTKKGYPQWVARLEATKKYVDDKEGMAHFSMTEPGYADWTQFTEKEEAIAYLVLFNNNEVFSADTALQNYEQLKLATGWDGLSFETVAELVGKEIQFQIKENEYNGKTTLQVSWINPPDADPVRELRTLDADEVKNLSKRLAFAKPAAKAVSAKSSSTKAAPSNATPTPVSKDAKPAPSTKKPIAGPPKVTKEPVQKGLAKELTQEQAWELVATNKGETTDDDLTDAWLAATTEVGEDKTEDQFTKEDWSKVAGLVVKDLSLTIA